MRDGGPTRDLMMRGGAPLRDVAPTRDIAQQRGGRPKMAVRVVMESARGLRKADWMGKSDPYCRCEIPGKQHTQVQTPYLESTLTPVWNFVGAVPDYEEGDSLEFSVWDRDPPPKKDDLLGRVILTSAQVVSGFSGELQLLEAGKGIHAYLQVTVNLIDANAAAGLTAQNASVAQHAGTANTAAKQAFSGPSGPAATSAPAAALRQPGNVMVPPHGAYSPATITPVGSRDPMGGHHSTGGHFGESPFRDYPEEDFIIAPPPPDDVPGLDDNPYNGAARNDESRPRASPKPRTQAAQPASRTGHQPVQRTAAAGGNQGFAKAPAAAPKAKARSKLGQPGLAAGVAGNMETYTVFLDRATNDTLGIEVQHEAERDLIVITLVNGGLAGAWNDNNPDTIIRPGDAILEVNGVSSPVQALLERCRLDEVLMITFGR